MQVLKAGGVQGVALAKEFVWYICLGEDMPCALMVGILQEVRVLQPECEPCDCEGLVIHWLRLIVLPSQVQ